MKLPILLTSRDALPKRQLVQALIELRAEVLEKVAVAQQEKDVRILQGRAQMLADLISQLSV